VTFVADAEGVIRYVFDSQLRVGAHVKRAKEEISRLLAAKNAHHPL
jgi:peroxiredoxin